MQEYAKHIAQCMDVIYLQQRPSALVDNILLSPLQ